MTVTVDSDFVRFGSKSYAINKINSVEVRERRAHSRAPAVIFAVLAGLFGFLTVVTIFEDGYVALVLGGITTAFALAAYYHVGKAKRREYQLYLMTSSSEAQAYTTRSATKIADLRVEIEAAMARQSRLGSASA